MAKIKIRNKLKTVVLSISLQERRKKKYQRGTVEIRKLKMLSKEELEVEYSSLKAKYEYRKNLLALCVITLVIALLTNLGEIFFEYLQQILKTLMITEDVLEILYMNIMISTISVLSILSITFLLLGNYMKNSYRLYERLLLVETIREENKNENFDTRSIGSIQKSRF